MPFLEPPTLPEPLTLPADVERLVSNYLRADEDVQALVANRVYTVAPKNVTSKFPLILVRRVGGSPLFSRPLRFDQARIQVDCYGGSKLYAWTMAATVMALLDEPLIGVHDEGVVVNSDIGALRDLPDETFDPPQPRWLFDAVVTARPA